jgi:hypothetical protein
VYGGDPRSEEQLFKERQERRRRHRRQKHELKRQIQELRLVSLAMFELITERTEISNAELIAKIDEIDRRDGVVDGRLREAGGPPRCARCHRVFLKPSKNCLYCGPLDPGA